MSKHTFKKLLSCFVAIALVVVNCMTTFASASNLPTNDVLLIYDDGETVLTGYTDSSGNIILMQYLNGKLIQRNTVFADNPEIIKREFFSNTTARKASSDTINVNDYGVLTKPAVEAKAVSPRTLAGTIKYRALIDSGYVYYGLKCNYTTKLIGPTTYQVNKFEGALVDLAASIAGALDIPLPVVTEFVGNLVTGAGISIVAGIVKPFFSDTVSCDKTKYTWTLTDTTTTGHTKTVYGYKYLITDVYSHAKGKSYYEDYTPSDWGTQALAIWFHNEMFSYSAWSVVGWS